MAPCIVNCPNKGNRRTYSMYSGTHSSSAFVDRFSMLHFARWLGLLALIFVLGEFDKAD
ncbi:hypothetical protein [Paraburkholderia sp. J67]|uniref:hypothetical protein n=1 Tax=Paraburkholderia sp. J67 TaxID=2805435 RepID=UPI0039F5F1EE